MTENRPPGEPQMECNGIDIYVEPGKQPNMSFAPGAITVNGVLVPRRLIDRGWIFVARDGTVS